ncbi:hypothetical protein [Streptomyces sp. NRRL S-350]|uniref:hypothetical protein n=1 Tax=Streptomyces sp. NRRL S-350 TaxID=1463902 RepID=UPI0004BF5143|nr:hypothetical protein [Streptomyces sp. NRRL S-350]
MRYATETKSYAIYLGGPGAWKAAETTESGDLATDWYEEEDLVDAMQAALRARLASFTEAMPEVTGDWAGYWARVREADARVGVQVGFMEIPGLGTGYFLVASQIEMDDDEPAVDPAWDARLRVATDALGLTPTTSATWIDAPIEL